jgi:hypothetical protein
MVPYKNIVVLEMSFGSDDILFLTTLSIKQWMYVELRPHMCADSRCVNVNSHVEPSQLGPYEDGDRIQSPKCRVLNKYRMIDNVQNYDSYNTISTNL